MQKQYIFATKNSSLLSIAEQYITLKHQHTDKVRHQKVRINEFHNRNIMLLKKKNTLHTLPIFVDEINRFIDLRD